MHTFQDHEKMDNNEMRGKRHVLWKRTLCNLQMRIFLRVIFTEMNPSITLKDRKCRLVHYFCRYEILYCVLVFQTDVSIHESMEGLFQYLLQIITPEFIKIYH